MRIDFTNINDLTDFSPLPEGRYLCRIAEVKEAYTQRGDPLWRDLEQNPTQVGGPKNFRINYARISVLPKDRNSGKNT